MYIEHDERRGTYVVRWRDQSGKKWRDEHVWETLADAKKRKGILEAQQRNNALGVFKPITLNEAIVIFEKHHFPMLKNDVTRRVYHYHLGCLAQKWGNRNLTDISFAEIVTYWQEMTKERYKKSTLLTYLMLLSCLYERFRMWNEMVPQVLTEKVALPAINPVKLAKTYLGKKVISIWGHNRKRRLSEEELRIAKEWCAKYDPGLWDAIKMAILTALRKSDLKQIQAGEKVSLTQEKTQIDHVMPIKIREVPNFGNLQVRWDALRSAMKWHRTSFGNQENPKHTTWHDLRHCAPSWLADGDFSSQTIGQFLGHTNDKMGRIYTHATGKVLAPAVKYIEAKLEAI